MVRGGVVSLSVTEKGLLSDAQVGERAEAPGWPHLVLTRIERDVGSRFELRVWEPYAIVGPRHFYINMPCAGIVRWEDLERALGHVGEFDA